MSKKKNKLSVEGGDSLGSENPFASLDLGKLPSGPGATPEPEVKSSPQKAKKSRGRVDVMKKRSAGGAGWVTIISGFVGISHEEKNELKKRIQKRCGTGGTLKNGIIEIQGEKRDEAKAVLEASGFRVVYVGG